MPRKKGKKKPVVQKRRPRGSGSLFRDTKRDVWVGRIHGQEFRHAEHAEVVQWLKDAKPPLPTVTVAEWCDRWAKSLTKVKPNTREAYLSRVSERIKPHLGRFQLSKLTSWDIEEAVAKWTGKPATIRATLGTLSTLLNAARRAKLIAENPVALAPKTETPEITFDLFTPAELRKVFDAGLSKPEWHTFAVLVGTGCRIGEAIALRPTDYHGATHRLSIARTWTRHGEGTPKSKHSRRTIDVPEELHAVLTAGPPVVWYESAMRRWRALLKGAELRYRAMHQVRHSFATYALAAGYSLTDLAAHLGHTPAELLRTYGHRTGADVRPVVRGFLGL